MQIKVRRLTDEGILPSKGTVGAAGFDLYLSEDEGIPSGDTIRCRTGIAIELPVGYQGLIYSRSGLASNGMVVANGVGVVDSDYRGELGILLHNRGSYDRIIKSGTRVAQLVVVEAPPFDMVEVDELSNTDRGGGGFGSTDTL